ncbi:hypothetical protein EI94DRAFT_1809664 [Lactarius quietus]|nr:hypothetical protein EI94DRAFT_1809664 [Lactarius quietus]
MSKVPLPIGDDTPTLPGIADTSKPSVSKAAAAPQLILSSETLDPLSAEIMPPPRDVLKKAPPTGGVGGFLDNIPLSQRIAPVLPEEPEEPVIACSIGSIGDGGDIGPQDESDTEDDDSDESDIQALDIPIPMNTGPPVFTPRICLPLQGPPPAVLPPIRYMNAPAAEVAVAAAAAASTAGAATTTALAAGPPSSHLDDIEHDLEHVPPRLLGWLKKARFGLAEMMGELAETSYQSDLPSGASDPSPQHLVPPVTFVITPRDSLILQEHVTQLQNGNAGVHAKIIEKVIPELYQLRPPNPLFDKKDAGKKWFYNHYNCPQRQYTKFTCKWSSRSVFYQLNRDEVLELARETSGMDPGAPGFLGALQDATTVLWNTLDADDQEDSAQAAKEWSQDAPPAHVQSRMASSLWKWIVQDFQRQLFKTCGIRTLVLSAYKTKDNDLSIGLDDVESILDDGISFLEFCPDWKTAPLWEQWTLFGIHCFSQVDDPLEEDPVDVLAKPDRSKMITTKIPISVDMSGCPKLLTVTMLDGYKTKVVQSMLREYCTAHMIHNWKEEPGYYAEAATAQRFHPVVFNKERCCWVELRWSNTNNYFEATRPAADDLHINVPLVDARPIDQQGPIDGQEDNLDSEPPRTEFQLRSETVAASSHTSERSPTPRSEIIEPEEIAVQSPEVEALAAQTAELHIPDPIRGIPYSYMTTQTEVSPPRLVINEQTGHVQQLQPEDMEAANRAMGPDVPDAPRYHHPKIGHSRPYDHEIMDHQEEEEDRQEGDHQAEEEDHQAEEEDHQAEEEDHQAEEEDHL